MQRLHGRRRHDGPRSRLRALDPEVPRSAAAGGATGSAGRGRREGGADVATPGAERMSDERRARRLHAVGQARAVPGRHAAPAGRALARRRHRFGLRRARHLRPLPGADRRRRVRQARRALARASSCRRSARSSSAMPTSARAQAGPPAVLLDAGAGRCRHRRAARQPGASAGRAQGRRQPRDIELESGRPPALRRGAEPDMHDPSGDLRRLLEALEASGELTRPRPAICRVLPAPAEGAAQGRLEGHRRGAWRHADHRRLAGLSRERAYGIAVDIGSTTIAAHLCDLLDRRGRGLGRHDESADPLRRGSDEPRLLRDDESGRRRADDRSRARRAQRARRRGRAARRRSRREDILEMTFVGNPIMHHLVLGIDPIELGGAPFALATTSRSRCGRPRSISTCIRNARIYVLPCIAGHVGADAAGVILAERPGSRRRDHAARRRRHQCRDRARQPRSAARLLEPDRPGLRRRADQLRPARGARRDRARAHRSRDARAALSR